ncbi:MAG TPA: hypothetical protein VGL79_06445 [Solirubrobacteraceae bacterium]
MPRISARAIGAGGGLDMAGSAMSEEDGRRSGEVRYGVEPEIG